MKAPPLPVFSPVLRLTGFVGAMMMSMATATVGLPEASNTPTAMAETLALAVFVPLEK